MTETNIRFSSGLILPTLPSNVFTEQGIKKIEEMYHATFVLDTSIQTEGGWTDWPYAIFYQPTPPNPTYSKYVAVRLSPTKSGTIMVTSGKSIEELTLHVLLEGDLASQQITNVVYSRYRHDFASTSSGAFIDGGRDYLRASVTNAMYTVQVVGPNLVIVP